MKKSHNKTALMKIQVSKNEFCQIISLLPSLFSFCFLKKSLEYILLVLLFFVFFLIIVGERGGEPSLFAGIPFGEMQVLGFFVCWFVAF